MVRNFVFLIQVVDHQQVHTEQVSLMITPSGIKTESILTRHGQPSIKINLYHPTSNFCEKLYRLVLNSHMLHYITRYCMTEFGVIMLLRQGIVFIPRFPILNYFLHQIRHQRKFKCVPELVLVYVKTL